MALTKDKKRKVSSYSQRPDSRKGSWTKMSPPYVAWKRCILRGDSEGAKLHALRHKELFGY